MSGMLRLGDGYETGRRVSLTWVEIRIIVAGKS
jgi:hypothetical protein